MRPAPSPAELRALFPYASQRTYLDTAAAGLAWAGHGAAVARFFDDAKSRGFDARPEWLATHSRVRSRVAAWLGVRVDDLVFLSNTTEALNLVAHSLVVSPGDRIVLAADEFPSVARCWAPARRAGACIVEVAVDDESRREALLADAVVAGTRALVVSQVHWATGTRLDLDALGAHCRSRGALLVVDGIQALGAVPVGLAQVDVYASAFFKWMLSGFGVAVLVANARARDAMRAAYLGYANEDDPPALQYAHVNHPALYGLDATLDVLERLGWPWIHDTVRRLGDDLFAAADRLGLDAVTPRERRAGIVVFRAPDGEACRARLAAAGISVSARGDGVRVSPHFYNTRDDVERCAQSLADALADR